MSTDKFSFALKRGFNTLGQVSRVLGDTGTELGAIISYFNIERKSNGSVDVAKTYGAMKVYESDIPKYRQAYKRQSNSAGQLDMLDRAEAVFAEIRGGGVGISEMNDRLIQRTEDFYQTYIAGERITQTYNPTARGFIQEPDDPDLKFTHRRNMQKWDEAIGTEVEIPHERIRRAWGLE